MFKRKVHTERLIRWTALPTLVVLLVKTVGTVKILQVEQYRLRVSFMEKKKFGSLQTMIRIMEASVMTAAKYGSDAWVLSY